MLSAEYFDILGLIAFAFLFATAIWMLKSKKKLPLWANIIFLIIAALGLIIDGYIVIKLFII